MNSIGSALNKLLRASTTTAKLTPAFENFLNDGDHMLLQRFPFSSCSNHPGNGGLVLQERSKLFYSTGSFDSENENENKNDNDVDIEDDDFIAEKPALEVQGVDPKRGWNYRGVHKAIICGKIGQAPIQKILRNGRTVTIFTVGTGGMYDQRLYDSKDLAKPAQWHRIAVHNEELGAYSVRQLVKNSSVYVEGDLETRVYNDSINGEIKSIPEICVRRDGRIRLVTSGESISNLDLDGLKRIFEH